MASDNQPNAPASNTQPELGQAFWDEVERDIARQQQPQQATALEAPAPASPSPSTQAAPTASPAAAPAQPELGEAFINEALGGGPAGAPQAAPGVTNAQGTPTASVGLPEGGGDGANDPSLYTGDGSMPPETAAEGLAATGLGLAKGAFATKDFFATGAGLFGDAPAEQDRSLFRQYVDSQSANLTKQYGFGYSLTEGLMQGAVGLLGAGKIKAIGAVGSAALTTIRATAAFEPHAENLFNAAQNIPGVSGPLTHYLASDSGDSTALGYAKNALTSLGIEGAAVGLLAGGASLMKALRGGDSAAIEAAHANLARALEDHLAEQDAAGTLRAIPSPAHAASDTGTNGGGLTASDLKDTTAPSSSSTPRDSYAANTTGLTPSAAESVVSGEVIPSATQRAAAPAAGTNASSTASEPFSVDTDSIERILGAWDRDQDALIKYGSWDAAIANGHTFGGEDRIPWQMLARAGADGQPSTSMDAFISRLSAGYAKLEDDLKGGAVQTDEANLQAVERRAQLWNEDPSSLIGALQMAGERAGSLRADMQASYAIAQRCMQDSWTMASRIQLGDFSEWGGSRDAAMAALKDQTGIAATLLASAQSIRSNSARAMRGLRSEFAIDPMMVRSLASLDGDTLVSALTSTQGNPLALKTVLQRGPLTRLLDGMQLYLVNNMLWNPLTHAIIFGSNAWQTLARPAMRAAGSLANNTYDTVGREGLSSYYYLATSVPDAFRSAVQAFKTGDSIIAPHSLMANAEGVAGMGGGAQGATGLGQAIAQAQFRPMNNVGDIFANTVLAAQKVGTFPTRMVSVQDELVKQMVYRAKVQAHALIEGQAQGLTGDELAQYVTSKYYDAFDSYGRATDRAALNEAKVATYQNDLNPTGHLFDLTYPTGGAIAQSAFNNPLGRVLLPFVRTPVNMFRQGVQLTPGLNLLQAEYRDAIRGIPMPGESAELAMSRQAQAIGQMGMGALAAGAAGTAAYMGLVTGGAPSDPKLAAEATADGWRPNSIVIPHKDGSKTYVPFDRFDPVMMPFALAADLVNILKGPSPADPHKGELGATAFGVALAKQLTDKLYLQSFAQTLDAILDPEKRGWAFLGKTAENYVPMASAMRLINPDPVMREAHDFVSAALGRTVGFSQNFPARRDWAGDPITVHKGLWTNTPADKANAEIERLALQQGASLGAPSSKSRGEADFRDITLAGNADPSAKGVNAYDRFQELAGHPERMPGAPPNAKSLRRAVAELVQSPAYQRLPDGDASTPGTKLATLAEVVHAYRDGARRFMAADSNVRMAEYEEQYRVAKALGYVLPGMPTPTNQADGMLNRLGRMFGFSGLHQPSPASPTTGTSGTNTGNGNNQ